MFGSFKFGEKRRDLCVMVVVKNIHFQSNEYFMPHSYYSIYQEKSFQSKLQTTKHLLTLQDLRDIPVNDTLKFHATLFENKNIRGRFNDKKRRIFIRQHSIVEDEEVYKDVGHFDLQLDVIAVGPRSVDFKYDIVDPDHLLKGQVRTTIRYRLSDTEGNHNSSGHSLVRASSSKMNPAAFENWSDDEEHKAPDAAPAPRTTMSRQISAGSSGFEHMPSLNRVNTITPSTAAAANNRNLFSASYDEPPAAPAVNHNSLQRKVTNESISSIGFTSQGQMVDASQELNANPVGGRYGILQPQLSASTVPSSHQNLNDNSSDSDSDYGASGPGAVLVAKRSTLTQESLTSSQSQESESHYLIQLGRSSSANSIRSFGTSQSYKSSSVKSVRFEDDEVRGAAADSRGKRASGGGVKRDQLTEEELFGVTYADMVEDLY